MGTLGRIFVLLNAFAALTFLMWGVGIYTNRSNWFTPKDATAEVKKDRPGMVDKFAQDFKDRNKTFLNATIRWEQNAYVGPTSLAAVERERETRRGFYEDAFRRVLEGKRRDGSVAVLPKVVKILKRESNDIKLDVSEKGETFYSNGPAPLESMSAYTRRIADRRDQLDVKQKEAEKLVKAYAVLSVEIFGTTNPRVLGLRDLIKEQDAVDAGARAGTVYLEPLITEREAQTEIFRERNVTLTDRLNVLQGYMKKQKTNVEFGGNRN